MATSLQHWIFSEDLRGWIGNSVVEGGGFFQFDSVECALKFGGSRFGGYAQHPQEWTRRTLILKVHLMTDAPDSCFVAMDLYGVSPQNPVAVSRFINPNDRPRYVDVEYTLVRSGDERLLRPIIGHKIQNMTTWVREVQLFGD